MLSSYHVSQGALEHGRYVCLCVVDLGAQAKVSNLRGKARIRSSKGHFHQGLDGFDEKFRCRHYPSEIYCQG